MNFLEKLKLNYINSRGVSIPQKVVVFESDDWGAIRSTGNESFNSLKRKGYQVDRCAYSKFDSIESNDDIESLLNALDSIKGGRDSKPKFTLNNILGNPDFEKIRNSNFNEYHFEPFTESLNRTKKGSQVMSLYREGIRNNLIQPQFHGKEHVHVCSWMKDLKVAGTIAQECFQLDMVSAHKNDLHDCRDEYLSAHVINDSCSEETVLRSIEEGLSLFRDIWGFKSITSISPCYFWNNQVEDALYSNGVHVIQSGRVQFISGTSLKPVRHYLGWKNKNNQVYFVRNAFFEPSLKKTTDAVGTCLNQVSLAFRWKVPAIISTHRVNYIGVHSEKNRIENIRHLKTLINSIIKRWPDVTFMSSDELFNTHFN